MWTIGPDDITIQSMLIDCGVSAFWFVDVWALFVETCKYFCIKEMWCLDMFWNWWMCSVLPLKSLLVSLFTWPTLAIQFLCFFFLIFLTNNLFHLTKKLFSGSVLFTSSGQLMHFLFFAQSHWLWHVSICAVRALNFNHWSLKMFSSLL